MKKFPCIFAAVLALTLISTCSCAKPDGGDDPDKPVVFERYRTDLTIHSELLNRDVLYSILLPSRYEADTTRHYPVIYMLHGVGDNNNSWNGKYLHANDRIKELEKKGLDECIYVFPMGYTTYYCNFSSGSFPYMDMFTQELIPAIDALYRTIPDRQHRCITGYSMGGFGAMVLPEKHPELFLCSAPLSMSFRTDEQYMSESQSGWDNQWGRIFGGQGRSGRERITNYYKSHCPFYQFVPENREALGQVRWFFTCGDDEEQLLIANDTLHTQLRDMDFPHEFRVGDGGHSSSYWMSALNEVLPMFVYYMNGGDKWPGLNIKTPETSDVPFNEDGVYVSQSYAEAGTGTVLYFCHWGLSDAQVNDAVSLFYTRRSGSAYAIVPCDLSKNTLADFVAISESAYPASSRQAFAIGKAGVQVFGLKDIFSCLYLVDAALGDNIFAKDGQNYYFSLPDSGENYRDMSALYRAVKRADLKFEYRVIKGTSDADADKLRAIDAIKEFITY